MKINLIIDGNYLLNKNVYALNKVNELRGNLEILLNKNLTNYSRWYPFSKIYLVSDSGVSWRKKFYPQYKGNRIKNNDIDWKFVFESYDNFKNDLIENSKRVTVLEAKLVEGDDWISYIINQGGSNLVISNDHDLKQLLNFSINDNYINFMSNEMYSSNKVFLPENYNIYINHLRMTKSDDFFTMDDEYEFIKFFNKFIEKREIVEVDSTKEYFLKIIQGDKSDNIKSAYLSTTKNGKIRGIGSAGALKLYNLYNDEFGIVDLNDSKLLDNISDLICEVKKISYIKSNEIKKNLELNSKLINLNNLPDYIIDKMNEKKY